MSTAPGKPDKRTAILQAALDLVAENGFHGAPTAQIAERAGVGVGSLYRYFKDKDELIRALFVYVGECSNQAVLRGYDPNAPIREQYLRLCGNVLNHLVENPTLFRFIEQYLNSPYGLAERREKLLDSKPAPKPENPLEEVLQRARAQQIIKDLPLPALCALTFGPIFFLIRDIHAGLIQLDKEITRQALEACWDAVRR